MKTVKFVQRREYFLIQTRLRLDKRVGPYQKIFPPLYEVLSIFHELQSLKIEFLEKSGFYLLIFWCLC